MGTPKNMPSTPPTVPPTVMAMMIHSGRRPVEFPRIFGPRIQSVKLLQAQNQNQEYQCFDGAYDKQNQNTGNGTDKGAEVRDHVGDAYDDTDQNCIGQAENIHKDETENSDDQGVNGFSNDKAAEQVVAFLKNLYQNLNPFLRNKGIDHGFAGIAAAAF